ncbi:hypothetical protein F-LCD7_0512 [Faustovirus]|nr:hypothetical protein F-LCD7_0512 [Faustovirus]
MTSQEYILPFEMIIEIARSEWRAWGKLGVCCKALHSKLKGDDPYALFTTKQIINPDPDEIWVGWYTHNDDMRIRIVVNSNCGFILIQLRDGRALLHDYEVRLAHSENPDRLFEVVRELYYIDVYDDINNIDDIYSIIHSRMKGRIISEVPSRRDIINEEQFKAVCELYGRDMLLK